MKNVVKILLYLFIAYLPIKVHGQNDYARQFEVMSQVDSLVKEKNFGESNSNIANLTIDAMDNFMARNYNKAIPQFIQIVDYTKVNRPNEYVQLVAWQNVLAMAYMNIGDYKKLKNIICHLWIFWNLRTFKMKRFIVTYWMVWVYCIFMCIIMIRLIA